MQIHWMIIFGIIGTAVLLYVLFFIYLLNSHPRDVWEMNSIKPRYQKKWQDHLDVLLLFTCCGLLLYGVYHISYFLLGWMPSDWGGYDYDSDEWVTTRSALSSTFSFIAGGFLCQAIGSGIKGRLLAEELNFEISLRNNIDTCLNISQLKGLREKFENIINNDVSEYFYEEGYEFLKYAQREKMSQEIIKEILRSGIDLADKRVSFIKYTEQKSS